MAERVAEILASNDPQALIRGISVRNQLIHQVIAAARRIADRKMSARLSYFVAMRTEVLETAEHPLDDFAASGSIPIVAKRMLAGRWHDWPASTEATVPPPPSMVIALVIVSTPKPAGSNASISPPAAVFEMAPANVLQDAVRLQGLESSPTPKTQVRLAWACTRIALTRKKQDSG